ncbi:VOC family protein [Streptacidiphilus jiangxiensis]|uniref:Glyoxalase/Bleomycin resistance protein/Dioxygenase superfamily protein n=1 Tax=Streptacidiphilus jiangxiensis TaxID=235985 RepID=A0A1H7HPZ6_STRJI|nr:VOC family protein [Streptacidiphilus jiangxiensis]SEK52349.1 Glyoxalase/Bleomycin resistance protein/Dioxygenase superfamily protein [Streptacidiphilus jiangxiensis]
MAIDLFAGVHVGDLDAATAWYTAVLGAEPAFRPNDTEAVWELAEHRYLYVRLGPAHAGHAVVTVLVGTTADLDARVASTAARGIEPALRETYDNGACKAVYQDPDGNELGFGGVP